MNREKLQNHLNILENQHHLLRIKEGDILSSQKKLGRTDDGQIKLAEIYTEMSSIEKEMRNLKSQLDNLSN